MEDFSPLLRSHLARGSTLEEGMERLREAGAHPVATIKALREVLGVDLGRAKEIFDASPVWRLEAQAGRELHEEVFRARPGSDK